MDILLKGTILLSLVFIIAGCNNQKNDFSDEVVYSETKAKRYGSVIKIKPEMIDKYKELHANVWPKVKEKITEVNIRNYSIYLKDDYLFSYFEYVGTDFTMDMNKMAEDSTTLEWWNLTNPCQTPLESRADGEWWANMEEVFHHN